MRDYAKEFENRVAFIRDLLKSSGAKGVIYGNSGGKDSALVGILCKAACDNTVGIMMPCASKRNFGEDMSDGLAVAEQFNIETRTVDLTAEKELVMQTVSAVTTLNQMARPILRRVCACSRSTRSARRRDASSPGRVTAARRTWATSRSGATVRMTLTPLPT